MRTGRNPHGWILRSGWVGLLCVIACAVARAEDPKPKELTDAELVKMARQIEKDVEEIRGWKFKHPVKTAVYGEEQLRKFIEKRVFEEELGGGKLEQTQAFLRMIGLIPADCDLRKTMMDVLLNQIGGFYDPPSRSFYMLKRSGVTYSPAFARVLIAHELTHALDDQYVELDKLIRDPDMTEDRALAVGAVVEGSATQLMTVYMMRMMKSGELDTDEINQVMKDEMAKAQAFIQAPRYFTTLMASYICGMYFVVKGDVQAVAGEGGPHVADNILRALRDPPQSSEQVLHPNKYWIAAERDPPVLVEDRDVEKLIERPGRFVVHRNTVGEALCALLTQDSEKDFNIMLASFPQYWTNDAAAGWGGDRFFLLADGPDARTAAQKLERLRGVWVTAWDTADDRAEFVADYTDQRDLPSRRGFRVSPRVHVFTFGYSAAEAEALEQAWRASPPSFRHGGRPWSDPP